MIVSPVRGNYRITQGFSSNEEIYKKFGLKGHNGQDIALPIGTEIFAPIDGIIQLGEQRDGYGIYIRITEEGICKERRQVILAHLSKILIKDGMEVKAGDLVGLSGNTGFSTGPHLHWGIRRIRPYGGYKNYENGFFGYEDIFEKGWILENKKSKY